MAMQAERDRLTEWRSRYLDWLGDSAFDMWWKNGADRHLRAFHETLQLDGRPTISSRRARVQARQSYVYAVAGSLGWRGPWQAAAWLGLDCLETRYKRGDGLYSTLISAQGEVIDETAMLYDQAFILLARASVYKVLTSRTDLEAWSLDHLARILDTYRHSEGGFRESGENPFVSNPHMHFLEAALAWTDVSSAEAWHALADEIVALCLAHFVDAKSNALHEYFDARWNPLSGEAGAIEPGHQFEWAWLLERWARLRGRDDAHRAAQHLFASGARGVDARRNVAMDELRGDLSARRASARLWPQTERLKASLILSETDKPGDQAYYRGEASAAADCLWGYLQVPTVGLWRDKMMADGRYVEEPAPASSFYHIACAIDALDKAPR